jgi:phosphatidylserine/phosphatidylglycerophosphate/cardiolipin synthase-like enzyme
MNHTPSASFCDAATTGGARAGQNDPADELGVLDFGGLRVYHSGDTEYDLRLRALAYDKAHPIRIRDLLQHTSGLPDYMDFEDVAARHKTYQVNEDFLGMFARPGMAQDARVPIQVVTSLRDNKQKSCPVLERFSTTKPCAVRYLREVQGKVQMYQLHAKMILADDVMAYIGSANFTDTSLHYNFEMGICTQDRALIARLHALFDYVFGFAARPAGQA